LKFVLIFQFYFEHSNFHLKYFPPAKEKKNAETFCKLSYHWKLLQFSSANQPSKSKMKTFGKNQTSRYGHPDKAWDGDDD
jgi:hypothetical protein